MSATLSIDAPPLSPNPPPPDAFNMAQHVLFAGAAPGDKVALEILHPDGPEIWDYARLRRAVAGIAGGLGAMGLAPGSFILLRLGNSVEFPLAFLGAIGAGLVPVPTAIGLTRTEITAMTRPLAPALIIASEGVALPDHAAPVLTAAELVALESHTPAPFVTGDPNRPAYAIFTSGTSGKTRAVLHAHRAIWARRLMGPGWTGLGAADRMMHAGAFNWTYTLGTGLMDPWAAGATALIADPGLSAPELLARADQHRATIFAATPGTYRQALRAPLPRLAHLRHALSAGEKLPEALKTRWQEASGRPLLEAFGMSECSTFLSASPTRPAPPDTLGYAQPGRKIAVLAGDTPAPRGQPGALAVHRSDPGLMLGYVGAPEETRARQRGEWFLTGDRAEMTEDGAVRYLGRTDDLINAGGFRVSPVEIEHAMAGAPGLHEAAAFEHRLNDTSLIALAYTGPTRDPEALKAHAAKTLAAYKCPHIFFPVPDLPQGRNGKLNRRHLRALAAKGELSALPQKQHN